MNLSLAHAASDSPAVLAPPHEMQGEFVNLDGFRLRVDCQGQGDVTILFEPGLGGSAFEWRPLQQMLMSRATVCVYDRAGYGWSTRSPKPRTARYLAMEADQMLTAMNIKGPLILVAHSFGGFIARMLALQRSEQLIGLVLIDTSHELQLERLEKLKGSSMMPKGASFVISPPEIPAALPVDVQEDIRRFSRTRKTYAALHAEMGGFRESAYQVRRSRVEVSCPVIVIRRGKDLHASEYKGDLKTAVWEELQQDLASLSPLGKVVVAQQSGHHVHADQPELVADVLLSLLDELPAGESASRH
ncbi:alpha/beta fold hydrolase [Granulosicoccus antarcticus]|nr:alpha/beta hydrolase [Granulosicoccus antarcticus]